MSAERKSNLKYWLLASGAFIFLLVGFNFDLNIYDEAIPLINGLKINSGEIPYKDFWTVYSPALYYLYAVVMNIIGWNIVNERIISIIFMTVVIMLIFKISEKILSFKRALIPYFIALIWFAGHPAYAKVFTPAMLLGLLAVMAIFDFIEIRDGKSLIFAGLFIGLASLFRYEFGIILILLFTIFLIYSESNKVDIKLWKSIRNLMLGWLVIFVPAIICLLVFVPVQDIIEQLIKYPMSIYPKFRALNFPNPLTAFVGTADTPIVRNILNLLNAFLFWLPVFIYIFTLIRLIRLQKENRKEVTNLYILVICIFGIVCYTQALVRTDTDHLLPAFIISMVLFTFMMKAPLKKVLSISLVSFFILIFTIVPFVKKSFYVTLSIKKKYELSLPRAFGIIVDPFWGDDYQKAAVYINLKTHPWEKIFVGLDSYDQFYVFDAMLYFLSERLPATKYYELNPGVTTNLEVQNHIISDLDKQRIRYIIISKRLTFNEPNQSSKSSSVNKLAEYIRYRYDVDATFGNYTIMKRN